MTDDTSQSPADEAAALKKKRLIGKLVVFALIIAFAWLRPKVEAWLEGNNGNDVAANQDRSTASGTDAFDTNSPVPGTLTISDPDAPDSKSDTPKRTGTEPAEAATGASHPEFLETTAPGTTQSPIPVTAESGNSPIAEKPGVPAKSAGKTTQPNNASPKTTPKKPLPKLATPSVIPERTTRNATANTNPGTSTNASKPDTRSNPSRGPDSGTARSKKSDPKLGQLTLVNRSREIFQSTAGLVYGRGSVDRHRLKHVLKHAQDNPDKPVHGVFSGDRDQILEWIDRAYIKGKKGGKGVRVDDDGDRVAYTVDLGQKIGYVGGQVGKRKGKPACRYLKLVVEDDNEVVTAYPAQSL